MKRLRPIAFAMLAVASALYIAQFFRARATRLNAEKSLTEIRAHLTTAEKTQNLPPAVLSETQSATPRIPERERSASGETRSRRDASQLIAEHPELSRRFGSAYRLKIDQQYRPLFKKLGLDAGQIDRFERRLFENEVDQLDLNWSAKAHGLKRDDPAIKAIAQKQRETLDNDLHAILGDDGFAALQEFRRIEGARPFVNDVATTMALSSHPLTGEQADKLTQLIGAASARFQSGGSAIPWDANWDAIMENASSFLTESQLAALRDIGDSQVRFAWLLPQFYAQYPEP